MLLGDKAGADLTVKQQVVPASEGNTLASGVVGDAGMGGPAEQLNEVAPDFPPLTSPQVASVG